MTRILCSYGAHDTNPWDEACRQWDRGDISTAEVKAIASDLFDGEALRDVLADISMVENGSYRAQ